jgi:hypothetical protein
VRFLHQLPGNKKAAGFPAALDGFGLANLPASKLF